MTDGLPVTRGAVWLEDLLCRHTPNGLILQASPGWQRLLGIGPEEMVGRRFLDFVHEQDVATLESIWNRSNGGLSDVEARVHFRLRRCDGSFAWLDATCWPLGHSLSSREASPSVLLTQARDVTERIDAERKLAILSLRLERDHAARESETRELRVARTRAEDANRAKSAFLANMSHEIRTPMNGIIGMIELLCHTSLDSNQRDYVETIRTSAEALLTLINDILDLSKIEAGRLVLHTNAFDPFGLAEDVVELFAGNAQRKGLQLACLVGPRVPAQVIGDPIRVRQILTNLTGNAVKFTEGGEVEVSVSVIEENASEISLRFAVRDTGIGIPEERQEAVFELYQQVEDGGSRRRPHGTGLGLTISRQLARLMGGAIGLQSKPGAGSTFWVDLTFPRASIDLAMVVDPPGGQPEPGFRALAALPDGLCRRALVTQLIALGCSAEAIDPAQACEAIRRAHAEGEPFSVILTCEATEGVADTIRNDPNPRIAALPVVRVGGTGPISGPPSDPFDAVVDLPLRRTQLRELIAGLCRFERSHQADASQSPWPCLGLRILLAEDDEVNRKVTARMLEHLGCVVDSATDGLAALRALDEAEYDVVLMDLQMPTMDGLEATYEYRRREHERKAVRRTPVIALTAHVMVGDRRLCDVAGMDGFISKPVRERDLIETLKPLVSRDRGTHASPPPDRPPEPPTPSHSARPCSSSRTYRM